MKNVRKISDLEIGETYYFMFTKGKKFARKVIVRAIINEEKFKRNLTELYATFCKTDRTGSEDTIVKFRQIGIGTSIQEAIDNFGEFDFEENSLFWNSFDDYKRSPSYLSWIEDPVERLKIKEN